MFSKWTFLQAGIVLFIAAMLVTFSQNAEPLQQLLQNEELFLPGSSISIMLFTAFVIVCLYLITFFQEKKTGSFLSHPVWDRMPIVLLVIFFLSGLIMVSVFTGLSLPDDFGIEYRWILDILVVYFLLLFYLLILSVLVRFRETASSLTTIHRSFFASLAICIVFVFLF